MNGDSTPNPSTTRPVRLPNSAAAVHAVAPISTAHAAGPINHSSPTRCARWHTRPPPRAGTARTSGLATRAGTARAARAPERRLEPRGARGKHAGLKPVRHGVEDVRQLVVHAHGDEDGRQEPGCEHDLSVGLDPGRAPLQAIRSLQPAHEPRQQRRQQVQAEAGGDAATHEVQQARDERRRLFGEEPAWQGLHARRRARRPSGRCGCRGRARALRDRRVKRSPATRALVTRAGGATLRCGTVVAMAQRPGSTVSPVVRSTMRTCSQRL